jgi:alpha-L-arabinofuranosidase
MKIRILIFVLIAIVCTSTVNAAKPASKRISEDLFGVFFEDINYAADGGLYAELVQNRSFEYSPSDRKEIKDWNSFTAWQYVTEGFAYGLVNVESDAPLNANNPHYLTLSIEDAGTSGVGVANTGFDGIAIKAGEKYDFSVFARLMSDIPLPLSVRLQSEKGEIYAQTEISARAKTWKKYTAMLSPSKTDDKARLVIIAKARGKVALDVVSLFPEKTFKNRPNGMRADLAQMICDLKPKFMRFPGGCLVHGDGLGNMYRWKDTIGPVEQRKGQRNIWRYHQSVGLGYYEYFQFCEDIKAKPVPVVPAAVSCQNSGGTWRIGGTGQRGIPMAEMRAYIQDVIDLIEYANGPATSKWGAKRAAAGHPKPFGLEYLAIGNEDKITPVFRERFKMIYDAVHAKHPEIKLIGTAGPFHSGEDFDLGWNFADQLKVPFIDEHYYETPEWFLANTARYDSYDRAKAKIYLGEYASKGNTLFNALAEASYMTGLERNGDVVTMASYAPMLANKEHTQWNPDLIYFTNTTTMPTANYFVQKMFSSNQGDIYYSDVVKFDGGGSKALTSSVVEDTASGDLILKIVNTGAVSSVARGDLSSFVGAGKKASVEVISGEPTAKNSFDEMVVQPKVSEALITGDFVYSVPAYSLSVIRVKTR